MMGVSPAASVIYAQQRASPDGSDGRDDAAAEDVQPFAPGRQRAAHCEHDFFAQVEQT